MRTLLKVSLAAGLWAFLSCGAEAGTITWYNGFPKM